MFIVLFGMFSYRKRVSVCAFAIFCFIVNALVRQCGPDCMRVCVHCSSTYAYARAFASVWVTEYVRMWCFTSNLRHRSLSCVRLHAVCALWHHNNIYTSEIVLISLLWTLRCCWCVSECECECVSSLYVQHSANWNEGSFVFSFRCRFLSRLRRQKVCALQI